MVHWSTNYTVLLYRTCTQTTGSSVTRVTCEQLLSVSQWACFWDALFKEGSLRDRAAKEHAIQIWNVNAYILCFCCNFLLRENLTVQDLPLHFKLVADPYAVTEEFQMLLATLHL